MENRRTGLSEEELKHVAEMIAEILSAKHACSFTPEEQTELKSLLKTKKRAATAVLWASGAVVLWIFKDAYDWIRLHLTWGGN